MIFRTLSGKIIKCEVDQTLRFTIESVSRSKLQQQLGLKLLQKFPCDIILQDFPIPGMHGMHLDFFIPSRKKAFECNGRQHYEYVPFYHGRKTGFQHQQVRDNLKEKWCKLNHVELEIIRFDEIEGE